MKKLTSVLFALLLAACGSSTPVRSPAPARPVDFALDGLPQEARVVLGLDLAAFGATPVGARVYDALGGIMATILGGNGIGPECNLHGADLGLVVIGFAINEEQAMGGLARGKLTFAQLAGCVEAIEKSKHAGIVHETVAGRDAIHADASAPASDNAWVSSTAGGALALAGNRAWMQMLVDPSSPRARANPELARAAARLDDKAPLWLAIVFDAQEQEAMVRGSRGQLPAAPSALRLSVHLSTEVQADLEASFDSAEHAKQVAAVAEKFLDQARAVAKGTPYEHMVTGITVSAQGADASVHATLDAHDVDVIGTAASKNMTYHAAPPAP